MAERHYTDGKTDKELIGSIGFGRSVEADTSAFKKVLITGAGSYVGLSFKSYAEINYSSNFMIDELDMTDDSWRSKSFSDYDIVYHVAGIAHSDTGYVSEEVKENYYKVNTDLAVETAKKAKNDGASVFVFMSSMIVYGDSAPMGNKKVIDSDTVPVPSNFYGDSKLQADAGIRDLADDKFKVIVIRPPMIYGKGSRGNYPLLSGIARKLSFFPYVKNERSMIYIENFCEFLCQVMLVHAEQNSTVLIPANQDTVCTADMVRDIAGAAGKKMHISKFLVPFVKVGSCFPGKTGRLINKAFGNFCYDRNLSVYEGLSYQKFGNKESIIRTEKIKKSDKIEKVCIVNCFDTYEHRVDLLYDFFFRNQISVKVYSSDFRHFEKCVRTKVKDDYELIHVPGYKKNLSLRRILSHYIFSKKVFKRIRNEEYDLVWAMVPPNSLVHELVKYKKRSNARLFFDIMDLWPETMPIARLKGFFIFKMWGNLRNKGLQYADKIITECDLFREKLGSCADENKFITLYLARKLGAYSEENNYDNEKISLCYLGSINNIIDIDTIVSIISGLKVYKDVILHIIGDGENRENLIENCRNAGAEVIWHGKIYEREEKKRIMGKCHYGLNIMKDSVCVGLTMKSMDYFEEGIPILNNIHGDTWMITEKYNTGYNIGKDTDYKMIAEYNAGLRISTRKFAEQNLDSEVFYARVKEAAGL